MFITLVCVIYQKKAFWAHYNIGVAFSYRKIKSMGRKLLKNPECRTNVAAILFFLSLTLITLVCVIYQEKAFWALYNNGLAFSYRKMQSKGRKSLKTHYWTRHVAAILLLSVTYVNPTLLCVILKESILSALQHWCSILILKNAV